MTASPAPTAPSIQVGPAIASMVTAIFLFASMNALVKSLAGSYPVSQIVFARAFFAILTLWPMISHAGGLASLHTQRPWGHAARSIAGALAMVCGFTALTLLPLAHAVALSFTAPLFTTVLGVLLLGETVRWRRTLALIVGFIGVMLMLRPDHLMMRPGAAPMDDSLLLGSVLALCGALCAAFAMITIRKLSTTERNTTIVFYFMLAACAWSVLLLPSEFVMPTGLDAMKFVAIGILGGLAQMLLTRAYRNAPVAVVAPFDYTAMVWATGYGFLVWGEVPDALVVTGACIVVGSGIYITLRELKLRGGS